MNHPMSLNIADAIITIDIAIIESPQPLNVVPLCKTIDPNGVALVKLAPSQGRTHYCKSIAILKEWDCLLILRTKRKL